MQSMAYFLFGRIEEAIEVLGHNLEKSLPIAPSQIARTYQNLAYFYTDIIHSKRGMDFNASVRAKRFIEMAKDYVNRITDHEDQQRMRSRVIDTEGYYYIMSKDSEKDINEGVLLCKNALAQSTERDVTMRYFYVHERIAKLRIANLQN
jgi:hypothetical protein